MVVSLGCDFQRDVAEWIDSDTNDPGYQIMEEDEIVAAVREKDGSLSSNSEVKRRTLQMTYTQQ